MLHVLDKMNTTNKTIHDLFYFKIRYVKKKMRSVSKEDTNQFLFLFFKNSNLHLMKMQIRFWFKKNFKSPSNEHENQFFI